MIPSFLLYLFFGLMALLAPELLITQGDIAAGNPFVALSIVNIVVLLAFWTAAAAWLLSTVAAREGKGQGLGVMTWRLILGGLGLLCVVAAWIKPVLSVDPLYYIAYGRQITAYGLSPYEVNLWVSAKDPIISQISPTWFHNIAFYGPVALSLYALANLIVPSPTLFGLATSVKLLWIPFYALLGWAVWTLARSQRYRATITLGVLANPMLLWFCLVDGHVDLLVVTFLLLAACAAKSSRPIAAGLAVSLAASIKIVGVICAPILFFFFLGRSARDALRYGLTFAIVYGSEYAMVKGGEYLGVIGFTREWDNLEAASLVPRLFAVLGVDNLMTIQKCSNGVFYLAIALICLASWRGKLSSDPCLAMGLAMAALFLTRTYYQPWYTLWFWPLLWLAESTSGSILASIAVWTGCMLVIWLVSWSLKVWILTLGAAFCLGSCLLGLRGRSLTKH